MKHLAQIMAASMALVFVGCSTCGLPSGAHAVGGGFKINWCPPTSESGTAILVEKNSGKIVMTKQLISVDRGFDFDVSNMSDHEILEAAFGGSMPANAKLILYFVPRHE